jgi:hypothetical protein
MLKNKIFFVAKLRLYIFYLNELIYIKKILLKRALLINVYIKILFSIVILK